MGHSSDSSSDSDHEHGHYKSSKKHKVFNSKSVNVNF